MPEIISHTNSRMVSSVNAIVYCRALNILLCLWFITFAVQGALYQASIYLIPILCLFYKPLRTEFGRVLCQYWYVLCLIVFPIFLSYLYNVLPNIGSKYVSILEVDFDPVFRLFWRVFIFSVSVLAIKRVFGLKIETLFLYIFIIAVMHAVIGICLSHEVILRGFAKGGFPRIVGLIGSPNEFGLLMVVGIVAGVNYLLNIYHRFISKSFLIACILSICLLIFCLLVSQSRSSWLAFLLSILFYISYTFTYKRHHINKAAFYVFVVMISLFVLYISQMSFFEERFDRLLSDGIRVAIWAHFISVWKENWLVGVYNLGDYVFLYDMNKHVYKNPHSVFLDVLVRSGVIGLVSFIGFLTIVFFKFYKSFFSMSLIAMLVVVMVGTMFSFSIYGKEFTQSLYAIIFMLFLCATKK